MIFDKFVHLRWNALLSAVISLHSKVDSPTVHRLRVTAKKLRTMSWVIHSDLSVKPLQEIYTACGAVREPEIMLRLLKMHTRYTEFDSLCALIS
jgi:CHAD domain-containing protein